MSSASAIRLQIEAALAQRIPSALTPAPRVMRPVAATGVAEVDALLDGGLPVGAISEFVGRECSGRASLAFAFLSRLTRTGSVAAWVDVLNAFDPESAAAAGVELDRLLWVRCGVVAAKADSEVEHRFTLPEKYLVPPVPIKGLHGGGCGGHPRGEVKGLAQAVGGLLRPEAIGPRCAEPQRRMRQEREVFNPVQQPPTPKPKLRAQSGKPWARFDMRIELAPLSSPIGANLFFSDRSAAL